MNSKRYKCEISGSIELKEPDRAEQNRMNIGVVCVKEEEFNEFLHVCFAGRIFLAPSNEYNTRKEFADMTVFEAKLGDNVKLYVAHFGVRKGAAVCGQLCGLFVHRFKLTHLGMVGCCAGRAFNTVVCAVAAQFIVKPSTRGDNDFHFTVPSFGNCFDVIQTSKERRPFSRYTLKNANLVRGGMVSYPSVQEDLKWEGDLADAKGVDMESFHLYHVCKLFDIQAMPVFKGVTDLGRELTEEEQKFVSRANTKQISIEGPSNRVTRKRMMEYAVQSASEYMIYYIDALTKQKATEGTGNPSKISRFDPETVETTRSEFLFNAVKGDRISIGSNQQGNR